MRKNSKNEKVIRAMAIGISAMLFGNGIPRKLYQLYGNSTYGGRNTSFYRIKYFHFNCIKWNFIWINWFSAITANSGKVRNNVYAEAGR